MPLPILTLPYRTIHASRDVLIVAFELPTSPERRTAQIAVLWDDDRDERILHVLCALRFRDPRILGRLIAVAERQGRIDAWCSSQPDECTRALSSAADVALRPADSWTANPAHLVAASGSALDRACLPQQHALRAVPERYALGLVRS